MNVDNEDVFGGQRNLIPPQPPLPLQPPASLQPLLLPPLLLQLSTLSQPSTPFKWDPA